MGCCTGFARFLLIIFNFIFWLSGAALLGVGIWILVDPDIEEYQDVIESASDDGNFLKVAAYILIGFGSLVFLIGFCGCCGAIRRSKCLLGLYIFFLIIVFAGELAAAIYVGIYKSDAEDNLKDGLKDSIRKQYNTPIGKAWDGLQKELKCCGGNGPSDYVNSTWVADQTGGKLIPISCCVLENSGPKDADECQKMSSKDYYYEKGCKDAIEDWIDDNSVIVIGLAAGLAALQVIVLICAICFCRNMEKED